ncbi:hypothetical protein PFICI_10554 [Pestalotiopsis fici W106-1]|uniref:Alpha/beta hydrolase fold-3 domain-containing protein n=1 Tax=Pestalotiopsis fici (strain W106-1 / CGMCC3.15140) TaxID=1229662 RepID=W3WZC8_PESFW|nr:uncharacterized protein PFICI_10554 [Pestalotiopsis fici W106-1]ETS78492.1 hypothetical protein PFICI_10554 [Pestalotiopsis fici W106-1]
MATTPIWAKQPFKALYSVMFMLKAVALLPLLVLRYGPKSLRPLPEQGLRICVVNALVRQLFAYQTATRSNGVADVESGHKKAKERFALVQPAEAELYRGVLNLNGSIHPAAVGGIWYPSPLAKITPAPESEKEKVVLHFPGGAFVLAFGTDANGQDISGIMKQHLHASKTFLGQYRVSSNDETRFPAAIQDLVTFYHYVLSLGVAPEDILLSGDSAAGNLVLGLIRYIEHLKSPQLPPPSGAMLWSPWVHVTAQANQDYKTSRNAQNDLLIGELLEWGANAYLPHDDDKSASSDGLPYISPLHHPFKTQVPLFIHAGGSEGFRDTIANFAHEMEGIEGNQIRYSQTDQASHNLLIAYKGLGLDREMAAVAEEANEFFSAYTAA